MRIWISATDGHEPWTTVDGLADISEGSGPLLDRKHAVWSSSAPS